jgi:mycofactocin precursor
MTVTTSAAHSEATPTEGAVPSAHVAPNQMAPAAGDGLVVEDLLVEDVSIDGMCGVY